MAFEQEDTKTPVNIGPIKIILADDFMGAGPSANADKSAYYELTIVFSDGSTRTRRGRLENHNTPAQNLALADFLDAKRAQAAGEVLP